MYMKRERERERVEKYFEQTLGSYSFPPPSRD